MDTAKWFEAPGMPVKRHHTIVARYDDKLGVWHGMATKDWYLRGYADRFAYHVRLYTPQGCFHVLSEHVSMNDWTAVSLVENWIGGKAKEYDLTAYDVPVKRAK